MSKVSRRLLWFLLLLFVFSFLDRINIGFAGLTMLKDLRLTASQFGMATAIFYLAYICCGIPSNLMLERIGARRWIATLMIAWGLASSATLFASGPGTLYLLRALVGVTEAGFLPGMLLYLTFWFPAEFRGRANALFMIAMPITTALGSLISGYLLALDGALGLRGWQWLFLLEGFPSVLLGLAVFRYLSDTPASANWLLPRERVDLEARLAADHAGPDGSDTVEIPPPALAKELLSPLVFRFGAAYFCLVNTLAMVSTWGPLIVKSFNHNASNITIGLLAAIPQVCTVIGMVVWGRRSDRRAERKLHVAIPMLAALSGWTLTGLAADPVLRLLGVCLASTGSYTAMSIFWTVPDLMLSRRARAVGIALINAIGNIGAGLSAVVVGVLKDLTGGYGAGLAYAAVLLLIGAALFASLPIGKRAA